MIKGILIVNNHGKARIVKFYEHVVNDQIKAAPSRGCSSQMVFFRSQTQNNKP
jgi:hypothetical protein